MINRNPSTTSFEWILESLLINGNKVTIEYDESNQDNLTRFFLRVNGNQDPVFAGENLRIIGELIIDSAIEGAFKRIDGGGCTNVWHQCEAKLDDCPTCGAKSDWQGL